VVQGLVRVEYGGQANEVKTTPMLARKLCAKGKQMPDAWLGTRSRDIVSRHRLVTSSRDIVVHQDVQPEQTDENAAGSKNGSNAVEFNGTQWNGTEGEALNTRA
jgi:hypothetical protein